jgi:hypothetical protein
MINRSSLVLAAAIALGAPAVASADTMFHDSNTGLPTLYYYQPLAQLQAEGLPLSAAAQSYLGQHSRHVSARTGRVSVRTNAQALGTYQAAEPTFYDQDNKQSGHY